MKPQRQQIPQFGAVVECHFPPHPFSMPSGRHCRSPLCRNGSKTRDPVPLRRSFPRWKVPVEMAFCHHLLIFVIIGSASEVALGGPAPVPCGEGDGQIAVPPSPSRIRYQLVCDRGGSWWPCTGFLRRRCRSNRCSAVTFSVGGVLTGLEAVCWRARAVVSALLREGGPDTYGGLNG